MKHSVKQYVLIGDPVPLARPRFAFRKVFDSQKALKISTMLELENQQGNTPLLSGPLHLDATFYMKTPQSMSKSKRDILYGTPHIYTPDLDNLIKWICDIGSGIIYEQDSIVSSISATKIYGPVAQTQFKFIKI